MDKNQNDIRNSEICFCPTFNPLYIAIQLCFFSVIHTGKYSILSREMVLHTQSYINGHVNK